MKRFVIMMLSVFLLLILAACSEGSKASEGEGSTTGEPKGNLEFIASYSPGGGHDTMLRTMVKVINEEKIIDHPITVVNKPGGSGAVGMAYTAGKDGSDNHIMAVTSSFLTTPLQGDVDMSYEDFTPIARLGLDPYVILVNEASNIDNFDDFLEYMNNKSLTFGGTAVGSGEHMLALQLKKVFQSDLEYVPFEGDGEVVTALLGKHIDVMANNIGSALEYVESGDMIPIAVSAGSRMDAMPDVPTLKELGYDIEWVLFRGIYGPPGMSEKTASWYSDIFKELSANEKWKEEYLDKYMVQEGFLAGDEFKKYLDELNKVYEENLTELGLIKKK